MRDHETTSGSVISENTLSEFIAFRPPSRQDWSTPEWPQGRRQMLRRQILRLAISTQKPRATYIGCNCGQQEVVRESELPSDHNRWYGWSAPGQCQRAMYEHEKGYRIGLDLIGKLITASELTITRRRCQYRPRWRLISRATQFQFLSWAVDFVVKYLHKIHASQKQYGSSLKVSIGVLWLNFSSYDGAYNARVDFVLAVNRQNTIVLVPFQILCQM